VFFVVLLIAFFILSQSGSGTNPLLTLFGISEEQLYPFLINLTSMIFGLFDFIGFLLAIIGIFMIAMAKKEDTGRRKKGIGLLVAGMLFFMMFSVIWASSYFYLKAKKDQYTLDSQGSTQYIQTDPEETTDLTAPATIAFDASELPVDTSLYTIISYVWDFGDGSTGTGATTSHRYTTKGEGDGRYVVTLTVTYRDNKTSEEAEEAFTVDVVFGNEQVNATFTATPESGTVPLEVEFDASESMDPDGEIVGYEWDLDGDGSYDDGDEVTAEYTYTQYGTYEAKLRVTDNNGETSTTTLEILVDEGLQPNGTIEVDLEEEGTAYVGTSYYFDVSDASSPNGEIERYEWDFGDGSTPTKNKTAKHAYEEAGIYTVTLTLTDEEGETGENTMEIEVVMAESAPTVVITTDQAWSDEEETTITGKVPFTVTFYGDESTDPDDNITNYEWDLDGDGSIDEVGEGTEYTYEEQGTYEATLYVQDAVGSEVQGSITVVVESQG
jgi:PKD repeat protein